MERKKEGEIREMRDGGERLRDRERQRDRERETERERERQRDGHGCHSNGVLKDKLFSIETLANQICLIELMSRKLSRSSLKIT